MDAVAQLTDLDLIVAGAVETAAARASALDVALLLTAGTLAAASGSRAPRASGRRSPSCSPRP